MKQSSSQKRQHDPGGKVTLSLQIWVRGSAVFGGPGDCYRYELSRVWDEKLPILLVVMMNPSTANPLVDDPSVAKCRRYAEAWGFGTLLVGNTFAYRATDKRRLLEVSDPVGPENDCHLLKMSNRAQTILFAFGQPHKSLRSRGPEVARLLSNNGRRKIHALRLSNDGTPCHPLYLPGSLKPVEWAPFSGE
jgi:hypothetical protein